VKSRWTASLRVTALVMIALLVCPLAAVANENADDQGTAEASVADTAAEAPTGPNPAVMAFDAIILRPLGFVVLVVGVGAFVPAAIITAPGGLEPIEHALEIFVVEPGKDVFVRPLGRF
jgi:hypothetical protein